MPVRRNTRSISGELLFELALDLHLHLHRPRKAGARMPPNAWIIEVAFIEIGRKLAAHARGQQQTPGRQMTLAATSAPTRCACMTWSSTGA